jgi:hypothetical protein
VGADQPLDAGHVAGGADGDGQVHVDDRRAAGAGGDEAQADADVLEEAEVGVRRGALPTRKSRNGYQRVKTRCSTVRSARTVPDW